MKVWIDGTLVPVAEARVSPLDHGLLVGDGVFETMKVIDGTPFAMRRHLMRLRRSADGLGLTVPDDAVLRDAVDATVAANGAGVARVRVTITGGPGPLGSSRGDAAPTVIVAAMPTPPWPPSAEVVVVPWPRNERGATAGLKTISYAENVVALEYAHERGGAEAIFANTVGHLCEGTGTNVFVGVDGRLLTPTLSSGCLAGITRELLLEITEAEETDLPIDALGGADEAFLASSTREVQAIATVDGVALPSCPGPLTAAAATAFTELVAKTMDP